MAAPTDHQVVTALADLLRGITVANGYRTDAGEFVFTEESEDEIAGDAIAIELVDVDESLSAQKLKQRAATLNLRVDVLIPMSLGTPRAQARAVLADVRAAVATINASHWLPGVTSVELGGRRIPPRVEGSQYIEASLDMRVSYTEQHTRS